MSEVEGLIYKEFEKTVKFIVDNDFSVIELEELREKMKDSRSDLYIIERLVDIAYELWLEENTTNADDYSSIEWACNLAIEWACNLTIENI